LSPATGDDRDPGIAGVRETVVAVDEHGLARRRQEYRATGIDVADLPPEPLALWQRWLADADECGLPEVNAMVVSTVDADGTPSSRTVLCKAADERGFVFFTNYDSRKSRALTANPRVSLLFPWHALARQVIVAGVARPVSPEESSAYFASRPRGAQIAAWASRQSQPVESRAALDAQYADAETRYAGADVPRPPRWGGWRVRASTVEFWQGRENRLHDRLRYRREGEAWVVERLNP
jgi:pyridoxamine 5'-phosphate oxidase